MDYLALVREELILEGRVELRIEIKPDQFDGNIFGVKGLEKHGVFAKLMDEAFPTESMMTSILLKGKFSEVVNFEGTIELGWENGMKLTSVGKFKSFELDCKYGSLEVRDPQSE